MEIDLMKIHIFGPENTQGQRMKQVKASCTMLKRTTWKNTVAFTFVHPQDMVLGLDCERAIFNELCIIFVRFE